MLGWRLDDADLSVSAELLARAPWADDDRGWICEGACLVIA